ncbi:hypothetical protein FIBSPDRAFT_743732, partial [Athelia psychrophila]
RNVILDYLCQNCNTKTARAFARDSAVRHLDADGDEIHPDGAHAAAAARLDETLRLAEIRQQIRMHILSGRVDEATALLNAHFPSVLGEVPIAPTARPPPPPLPQHPSSSPSPARAAYVAPTTSDPAHLSLNLRVLAFSEAARTVPLAYPPHPHPQPPPTQPHTALFPKKSHVHEHDDPEAKQTELLVRAQKLYAAANALENPAARARYLAELAQVGGLLAYTHPENSPMAKYLSQERRAAVAEQINSAVLRWTGRPAVSTLELYTRHTTVLWGYLSHDPQFRPPGKRPAGLMLPPAGPEQHDTTPPSKGSADKDMVEAIPPFDFPVFLDSKT